MNLKVLVVFVSALQCWCMDRKDSHVRSAISADGNVQNTKSQFVRMNENEEQFAELESQSESSCELVSSRGIMKSTDVHPAHPQSDTSQIDPSEYQSFLMTNTKKMNSEYYINAMQSSTEGATVYVITTALPVFKTEILPKVTKSFVLVTGDSDEQPEKVLGDDFQTLIEDPRILKWFAQNTLEKHEKLVQIPIGLDYHTNSMMTSPRQQENELLKVQSKSNAFKSRDPKIFADHFAGSHPERDRVFSALAQQPKDVEVLGQRVERNEMWKQMAQHRFVASPRGHGIDCHRTWEALALGSVAMVSAGPHNKIFTDNGLPVVEMDEKAWDNVDSPALKAAMAAAEQKAISHGTSVPEALHLDYWVSQIRDSAKNYP